MRGNPVNYTDPTGLLVAADDLVVGGSLLAVGCAMSPSCSQSVGNAIANAAKAAAEAANQVINAVSDAQRQSEYEVAKNFCDTPPPSGSNDCSTLSRKIDHAEQCISLYEAWDNKWLQGRHDKKLQSWRNRLQNLKDEHKRNCTNKCP